MTAHVLTRLHGAPARASRDLPSRPRWLATSLLRAGLSADASTALIATMLAAPGAGLLIAVLVSATTGVVVGVVGIVVPASVLLVRRNHRARQRCEAAPELLAAFARHLRAGGAPSSALVALRDRCPAVLRESVGRVAIALELGAPLDRAFDELLERGDRAEMRSARMSLEFALGDGAVADALDSAAESLRTTLRLDGEVTALTAQVRLSAQVLVALPVAFLGLGAFAGADQIRTLLETPVGRFCLISGSLLDMAGWLWLRGLTGEVRP